MRANVVRITDDSTCPVCGKRLGDAYLFFSLPFFVLFPPSLRIYHSIFARYPSGVVIHYLCYKQQSDKNIDPVTGERYVVQTSSTI